MQNFENLDEDSIIDIHLRASSVVRTIDYTIKSTLAVTEREVARALANENSKNIIPLMGCAAIIEQLGTAYMRTDVPEYPIRTDTNFKKGLYYFANIDPQDQMSHALYALRNGIVHNASFYSIGRGNQASYNFVYNHDQDDIVVPAVTPWDGSFPQEISLDTFTSINPSKLWEMVQNCINVAEKANKEKKIRIILGGGKHELIFRYLKWMKLEE